MWPESVAYAVEAPLKGAFVGVFGVWPKETGSNGGISKDASPINAPDLSDKGCDPGAAP
jgi:hypothetical protein